MQGLLSFAVGVAVGMGVARCCARKAGHGDSRTYRRPEYVPPGDKRPTGAEFAQEMPPDANLEGGPEQIKEPRPSGLGPQPPIG